MSEDAGPVELDPFAFLTGVASRVPGLGGTTPGYDPTYVFHTPYVRVARGPATFTIIFDNAQGKHGTLTIRIHMLPEEPGATARMVNSARIRINRLVKDDGRFSLDFDGYRGVTYAVTGSIADSTDIQADRIRVVLDRPANEQAAGESFVDARSTAFGEERVHASSHMISAKPATMELAVSQPYSAEQMREAVSRTWLERLGLQPAREQGIEQWQLVYKLQAFSAYGLLQPGARALGFTRGDEAFVKILEANGLETRIAEPDDEQVVAAMDPLYPPARLCNFDALWATDPGAVFPDASDVSQFVDNAMACLRPGGLAIFMLATTPRASGSYEGGVRLTRIEIERLALILISGRNEVAQLKPIRIAAPDSGNIFGMIARKQRTVL